MKGRGRLKLALGVFLVLLFGAVSVTKAQESPTPQQPSQSSSTIHLKTAEEINDFLTTHYSELSPEDRDLLQKALAARQANDGQGNFLFLPAIKQVEVISEIIGGLFSSLWPTYNAETKTTSYGVLGHLASLTDGALNALPQPVTAKQMLASLSPTKQSFAQQGGAFQDLPVGYQMLGGFSTIVVSYWTACRNFAYALLTAVLVIFGFLIMFRQNIEPRVTMTITNALPRIAMALVLITFSYAISGLIVDVGRVADGILKGGGFNQNNVQAENHSIFTLLASFADVGLTNISATFKSAAYVWKFSEDTLDRNFPEWRCDYRTQCTGVCAYRPNYKDQQNPGPWKECPPFSCPLGPFGLFGRSYSCTIIINPKATKVVFWPGGPERTIIRQICPELISPDEVPIGGCRAKRSPPDAMFDAELYPYFPIGAYLPNCDKAFRSKPCCNDAMAACHDAKEIPWSAPFPRNFGNVLELWVNKLILIIVGALLNFLFFITLLQTIFSLLFKLLSCFAMWFLSTIFSPLVFMWSAIPGQEETAMTWAKNFLANVLAFPAVNFIINLALAIARQYAGGGAPPAYPSMLFIGNPNSVAMLVPFGIILMTPTIPDMLKDIIGVKGGKGPGAPEMGKQMKKLPLIGGLMG